MNSAFFLYKSSFFLLRSVAAYLTDQTRLPGRIRAIFAQTANENRHCQRRGKNVGLWRRRRKKIDFQSGRGRARKGSQKMKGAQWMDIRSDRQKGLSYVDNVIKLKVSSKLWGTITFCYYTKTIERTNFFAD